MKRIAFKRLKIQNFLSIGQEPVEIEFQTGLNIITGINKDKEDRRNGVGKSSIADSLFFVVFGQPLRPIKNEHVIHDAGTGKCACSLEVDIINNGVVSKVKITRTLGPSTATLIIDGADKTLDSIASTTEYIQQLLSCTPEVFEHCVILTINTALPFMSQKKQDKRKFIESIFNLEVFSKMLTDVKSKHSKSKGVFDVQADKYTDLAASIAQLHEQQKNIQANKDQRITSLVGQKNTLAAQSIRITAAIQTIEAHDFIALEQEARQRQANIKAQLATVKTTRDLLVKTTGEHQANITSLTITVNKILNNQDTCAWCLRGLSHDDKIHIDTERQRIQTEIIESKTQLQNTKASLATHNQQIVGDEAAVLVESGKLQSIELLKQEIVSKREKLATINSQIEQCDKSITSVNSETASFEKLIIDTELKKTTLLSDQEKLSTQLSMLEVAKVVFSEEGVKALLVKKIINIFNDRLNHYLKKLDANCSCLFNEYFEETITNDKGRVASYHNFSGAERKSIDLACLFTFMDLRRLQGDVEFNFSVYDELLDTSLDEKGVEIVIGILRERVDSHKECIFIISHRKESTRLATGHTIFLEKSNGVTRRVDFAP